MTPRKWKTCVLPAVLALSSFLGSSFAQAAMVLADNVMVSMPSTPKVEALGLSAPGRWSITVTDLAWPQVLQSLSFAITDFTGVLATRTGVGTLTYDVLTPTNLFATVYALPNAAVGSGLYHINIDFMPAAPQVPLPAAVWLLLSGLGAMSALRRKHATVTNSVVQ